MNYKRIFCTLTAFSIFLTQYSTAFSDVSDWASETIKKAEQMGIVPQSIQNTKAQNAISREEFCAVSLKLYENISGKPAPQNKVSPFTDTDSSIIASASELGIIKGRGNGIFDPYSTITRQEFCVMLSNVITAIEQKPYISDTKKVSEFDDSNMVSEWAKDAVESIVSNNIMTGSLKPDGKRLLEPLKTTSREQAIVMSVRFAENYSVFKSEQPEDEQDGNDQIENEQNNNQDGNINNDKENNQQNGNTQNNNNNNANKEDIEDEKQEENNNSQQNETSDIKVYDNIILPEEAASLSKEERMTRIFGKPQMGFKSKQEAEINMTEIVVNVWKLQKDNTKKEGKIKLKVNRNLALVYQKIFDEIFESEECFPIKDAGVYAWRANTRSEHRYGTAIDLNWNENMECYVDEFEEVTQIITGSHWLPYEDPYSIPADGDVVRIFKKYGFAWGGDEWSKKRDYMHFSYFGT